MVAQDDTDVPRPISETLFVQTDLEAHDGGDDDEDDDDDDADGDDDDKVALIEKAATNDDTREVIVIRSNPTRRVSVILVVVAALVVMLLLPFLWRRQSSSSSSSSNLNNTINNSNNAPSQSPSQLPTPVDIPVTFPPSVTPVTVTVSQPSLPTTTPKASEVVFLPTYPLASKVDFSNLQSTLQECAHANDKGGRCLMYTMRSSGMCSQLINAFVDQLYVRDVFHRDIFIVDETNFNSGHHYEARHPTDDKPTKRTTFGLMTAYFTPTTIAVLSLPDEERPLVNQVLHQTVTTTTTNQQAESPLTFESLEDWYALSFKEQMNMTGLGFSNASPLWLSNFQTFWLGDSPWLHPSAGQEERPEDWLHLYHALIDAMCPNLQFNKITWKAILKRRQKFEFPPDFRGSLRGNDDTSASNGGVTVAFHVRRTDKLEHESKLYPASDYVTKLLNVITVPQSAITECFLATDDYDVVDEMQKALDELDVTCTLYYTPGWAGIKGVHPGDPKERYNAKPTEMFLTEMSMLIEADYFVGTFNSNVAGMVSVLRACPTERAGHDRHDHFARSYGVDSESWYFRTGTRQQH